MPKFNKAHTNFNKALTKTCQGLIEILLSIDFRYHGKWLYNKKDFNLDIYLKVYFDIYLIDCYPLISNTKSGTFARVRHADTLRGNGSNKKCHHAAVINFIRSDNNN